MISQVTFFNIIEEICPKITEFQKHELFQKVVFSWEFPERGEPSLLEVVRTYLEEKAIEFKEKDLELKFHKLVERKALIRSELEPDFPKGEVISTGIEALDEQLGGGFHRKTISVITGEVNQGKTTATITIGANAILEGQRVLHIVSDERPEVILEKYVKNLFGSQGNRGEPTFEQKQEIVGDIQPYLWVLPASEVLTVGLSAYLERVAQNNGQWDLLIIDDLRGIIPEPDLDPQAHSLAHYARRTPALVQELQKISQDYDSVVLITSNSFRMPMNRGYGTSGVQLFGGMSLNYACSCLLRIERDIRRRQEEERPHEFRLVFVKNRYGNGRTHVSLTFNPLHCSFS